MPIFGFKPIIWFLENLNMTADICLIKNESVSALFPDKNKFLYRNIPIGVKHVNIFFVVVVEPL